MVHHRLRSRRREDSGSRQEEREFGNRVETGIREFGLILEFDVECVQYF
jgi:hypothetical protein